MDYGNCIFCNNKLNESRVCGVCNIFCHRTFTYHVATSYIVNLTFVTSYNLDLPINFYFFNYSPFTNKLRIFEFCPRSSKPDKMLLETKVPTDINLIKSTALKFLKYKEIL